MEYRIKEVDMMPAKECLWWAEELCESSGMILVVNMSLAMEMMWLSGKMERTVEEYEIFAKSL